MSASSGASPAGRPDSSPVTGDELATQYRALRDGVGAFELPRDVLRVAGPDALAYLQGQLSQDLDPVEIGSSVDSLLLAPDGKLVATLRVTRVTDDAVVLDCDGGTGEAVVARLGRFKLRSKFDMTLLPWSCVAVRGPGAAAALGLAPDQVVVTGDSATGDPANGDPAIALVVPVAGSWTGFDLLGPAPAVPEGVVHCGRAASEACRIEAGIPTMGAELDEKTIAAEAHLVEDRVSFTKGCYTGQELVARLDSRGNRVARRLCGLVFEAATDGAPGSDDTAGTPPAEGSLPGVALVGPDGVKEVGRITSAAFSPGLGGIAALAYVHRSVDLGETVRIGGTGPGAGRAARVRDLPMV
jgi:folate-binding protein YgfZ